MNRVFTFDHDHVNAPYILPNGQVHYPFGNDYCGHGHPSVTEFMLTYTNPERSETEKQRDLQQLIEVHNMPEWRDRYHALPRDYAMGSALLTFLIRLNSGEQTIHEVLSTEFDQSGVKEVLVRAMGWSAIERFPHHTITTAVPNPNQTFFDYRLMGYNVLQVPQLIWDEVSRTYATYSTSSYLLPQAERDATEELALIDEQFPLDEWWEEMDVYRECTVEGGCDKCDVDHRYHLLNGQNPVTRQLARRAAFFKNDQAGTDDDSGWSNWRQQRSVRPPAALSATDTPYSDRFLFQATARQFKLARDNKDSSKTREFLRTIDD